MAPTEGGLTLGALGGKWVEGKGLGFVATILPGGRILYDGKHKGKKHDLIEKQVAGQRAIARLDGWMVDMQRSSADVLVWTKPGEDALEWHRIPETKPAAPPAPAKFDFRQLGPPICQQGHRLESKTVQGGMKGVSQKRCRWCQAQMKKGTVRHSCKSCDYHMCDDCVKLAHPPAEIPDVQYLLGTWAHCQGGTVTIQLERNSVVIHNPKAGLARVPVAEFRRGGTLTYLQHTGRFKDGAIAWSNGSVWTKKASEEGMARFFAGSWKHSGGCTVSISQEGEMLTIENPMALQARMRVSDFHHGHQLHYLGFSGKLQGTVVTWSNGSTWTKLPAEPAEEARMAPPSPQRGRAAVQTPRAAQLAALKAGELDTGDGRGVGQDPGGPGQGQEGPAGQEEAEADSPETHADVDQVSMPEL